MATEYATPRDRASAALAEFRRRTPLMTGFARSFSGNQRVRIIASGSGSFTDGDQVHLEVPLTLADKVEHIPSRCDQWDSRGFQMCPACAIRDDLNYQLFHEIAHIWGGSFQPLTAWNVHGATGIVKKFLSWKYPDTDFMSSHVGDTWMKLSYRIDPFIKELWNCFEDARVNGLMAKARPGVRAWRRAFELRLIEDGVRRFDPRTNTEISFHPGEAPLNAQMAYSFYFMAADGGVPFWADDYVRKQLSDPRVAELINEAIPNEDSDRVFEFAVRAYALMADMGFFGNQDKLQQNDDEQDDQGAPLNAGDEDEESDQSEDDGEGGESGQSSEAEGEDEGDSEADGEEASDGGSDDEGSVEESDPDSPQDGGEGSDESGSSGESSDGSGEESSDDEASSDGVAENASEDEGPGEADSAHEGESNPGAGGESEADEVDPDEGDESTDGSNPGDSGEGAPEDSDGNASEGDGATEGDEASAPEGEGSLEDGDDPEADAVDDAGGSGEVQDADGDTDSEGASGDQPSGDGDSGEDADQEAGSEGDGPGASEQSGEAPEGDPGDSDSRDDSSVDAGGDHDGGDEDPGSPSDGGHEAEPQDEADDSDGSSQGGDEDGAASDDAAGQDDNLATGQPGDSTEGEPGDGADGEGGGGDSRQAEGDDLEADDGDEESGVEPGDRSDAGVDEDFDGDPSGESDGNAGTHGSSGSTSSSSGEGNSSLSEDDGDDDPWGGEEADVAPVYPQDDTPPEDREWGDADDVHEKLEDLFGHHRPNEEELQEVIDELERIINLGDVFDSVPRNVAQVWWNRWDKHVVSPMEGDAATSWTHKIWHGYWFSQWSRDAMGIDGDFRVGDAVIGKALLKARRAFADNARKKEVRNLKSGRVNARSLGKRAPVNDPRLFKKIARPGKRDYFVVIGLDLSASTADQRNRPAEGIFNNLALIKRSAMAQAEILSRLGVKFAIYGHSCKSVSWAGEDFAVNMYVVKEPHEPWNEATRRRLEALGPDEGNLDGHTLQIYRKIAEKQNVTDRIVMYYTDGQIPAANGEEEGGVLVREVDHCSKNDITLMGVGIRTDSLAKFGFNYVRVDTDDDIVRVVDNLEERLAK